MMSTNKVIDVLFGLTIILLLTFPTLVFLLYGLRQPNVTSNAFSNQENENSEYLKITWIADWLTPSGKNEKYENFVVYLWWPDNAEFLGIRWIMLHYHAKSLHKTFGWRWYFDTGKIYYETVDHENKRGSFERVNSLPEWLLPHVPEFSFVEMDTPTGRRTVVRIFQKEYWESFQYNINVWIRIPRRVAENREFTGIELGENIDLIGQRYCTDKAYFYFDYEPKKPIGISFHLNLGYREVEGVYMNTLLTATVVPGKWIKSRGYGVGGCEILD